MAGQQRKLPPTAHPPSLCTFDPELEAIDDNAAADPSLPSMTSDFQYDSPPSHISELTSDPIAFASPEGRRSGTRPARFEDDTIAAITVSPVGTSVRPRPRPRHSRQSTMTTDPGAPPEYGAEPSYHEHTSGPVSYFGPPLPSALELYQKHSRRVGRFHGIPGYSHLPLDIFKPAPPWQDDDPPVSPDHARRLYEEEFDRTVREDQEKARADGAAMDKESLTEERAAWEARVALTELILQHRVEVYHEYHSNLRRAQHRQQTQDSFRQRLTAASSQYGAGVAPHHAAMSGMRGGATPMVRQHQAEGGFGPIDPRTNGAMMPLSSEQTLEPWQPMPRPLVGEAPLAGDFNSAIAASMTGAYGRLSSGNVELQLRSAQMQRELDAVLPRHGDFAHGMAPHSHSFSGQDFHFGASGQVDMMSSQPSPASRSQASLGAAGFDPASPGVGAVSSFHSSQGYSTQSAMMQSNRNDPFFRTGPISPGMASQQHGPAAYNGLSPVSRGLSGQVVALYDVGLDQHAAGTNEIVYSAPKRKRASAPTSSKQKLPPEWQEQVREANLPTSVISEEALQAGCAWRKRSREQDALAASVLASVPRPRTTNPAAAANAPAKRTNAKKAKVGDAPKPRAGRRRANPPTDSFPISNAAAKLLVDHGMVRERHSASSPTVASGDDNTPRGVASAGILTGRSLTLNATAGPAAVLEAGPPTPRRESALAPGLSQGAVPSSPPSLLPAAPLTPRVETSSELSSLASDMDMDMDSSPTPSRPRSLRQGKR